MSHRKYAFTLVEIMIVVLIMGVLMTLAVPSFIKGRESGRRSSCIRNLKLIDSAKEQWAMDTKKNTNDSVALTDLVGATLYIKQNPTCPSGGTYTLANVGFHPTCNIATHSL